MIRSFSFLLLALIASPHPLAEVDYALSGSETSDDEKSEFRADMEDETFEHFQEIVNHIN